MHEILVALIFIAIVACPSIVDRSPEMTQKTTHNSRPNPISSGWQHCPPR